ncbi:hypothetical protein AB4876_02645 [Zhongshania guokunii]|uniref:Uncharacterized protein n=1 Tax=Zhongshania guokunii TaxID=641783 RepID=A0ABV3U1K8_9GAMM
MKLHHLALLLSISMSSASHAQDLVAGLLGSSLSPASVPNLDVLSTGLPVNDLVGGLTPLALETVNSALPTVNQLLGSDLVGSVLPVLTDLTSSVGASALPMAIDLVNSATPQLNVLLGSGLLGGGIPLVGGDLTSGLLPIAIELLNTTVPVLPGVL